jgi:hypothetical protein
MTTITIEVPDDLADEINQLPERVPEILALGLERLSPAPAHVYRYILEFLASNPTAEEIAAFRPTFDMETRLRTLLERSREGSLTPVEIKELDEYEQIEHFIIMLISASVKESAHAIQTQRS